jgi:hypothetical protein
MVATAHDQPGLRQSCRDVLEGLDHQLEALISSPLAKRQNAVLGISPAGEIRKFRRARENSMRAQMDVIPPIFFVQNFAVPGHQHGN